MSSKVDEPPRWLTRRQVLSFHGELIERFGGAGEIRDRTLLESALARPKHKYQYEKPSLFELAAAYGFGIIKNHPFHDGNKRAGATAIATFLYLNGTTFKANEVELVSAAEGVAEGWMSEEELAAWIENATVK